MTFQCDSSLFEFDAVVTEVSCQGGACYYTILSDVNGHDKKVEDKNLSMKVEDKNLSMTSFPIFINMLDRQRSIRINVTFDDSIYDLKLQIENETGIPNAQQMLNFCGKTMDNSSSVADNNIKKESTVVCGFSSALAGGGKQKSKRKRIVKCDAEGCERDMDPKPTGFRGKGKITYFKNCIEMGLEEPCPWKKVQVGTPNEDDRSSHVFANSQGANLGNNFDSANDFQKNSRQTACLPQSSIPNNSPVNSPSRTAKDINGAKSNSGRGGKKKFRRRIGSDPNGSGGGGGIGPNGGE